jgi:hypothetical protein
MLPSSWGPGLQNSMGLRAALLLDKGHGARCQSGLQGRVGEVSKAFGTKGADGRLDPFAKVIHGWVGVLAVLLGPTIQPALLGCSPSTRNW